mmetsp:Transcript_12935/g.24022  ORF Transcript_12935/g.24022 Transcript_12935/m.24022 type:complete len:274 (-) Transcript_12935:29-850(-)
MDMSKRSFRPRFVYGIIEVTSQIFRTDIATGQELNLGLGCSPFKEGCSWCEVPGGFLYLTGGFDTVFLDHVISLGAEREFSVTLRPHLLTKRQDHGSVYHSGFLYIIGGNAENPEGTESINLSECERYSILEGAWEAIPPLLKATCYMSVITLHDNLYAVGGNELFTMLDLVQVLNLQDLSWTQFLLHLPAIQDTIPCFKLNDEHLCFIVDNQIKILDSATHTAELLKDIEFKKNTIWGEGYYNGTTLVFPFRYGAALKFEVGELGLGDRVSC